MRVSRWKLISMPVVMIGLASPLLLNCSGVPGLPKPPGALGDLADAAKGCDEMANGDFTKLEIKGDAAVQAKVKGFLNATYGLNKAAIELRTELITSCTDLGKALGASDADLKGEDEDKTAEKACNTAAAKISEAFKAGASGQIGIEIDPPKCYVPVEAMTKCLDACGSPIKPGKLEASCKGGEIVGKCEAECKGACTVEAGADCSGTCKAACQGKCEANFKGTCGGKCEGKCDGANAKGACAGTCEGKCDAQASGTCGGTCEGKCSGSCELKAKGKCSGTCQGGCSAEVKEPKCTGDFQPPEIDPSCQLSCTAKTVADATCEVPNVRIVAKAKVIAPDVKKLATALQISLPRIVKVQLGTGKRIVSMTAAVVKAGDDVKGVATAAGGKAAACIGSAVKASVGASASIDVNVKASVNVGGSFKAGG